MRKTISVLILICSPCFSSCTKTNIDNPVSSELLGKKCERWRDPLGIPHFRAQDELTAMACFGYAHGRDRAWQMDFLRKIAQGHRAEILGKEMIRSDFLMRMIGLEALAQRIFDRMPEKRKRSLWAYSLGANRGMEEAIRAGVYEFKKLGYLPEAWLPTDSIALILLQSFDQTRRGFEIDLNENEWIKTHGNEASRLFSWDNLPWDTSVLKREEVRVSTPIRAKVDQENIFQNFPFLEAFRSGENTGSNSWVIAPKRSATRTAWLANDPHLALTYPPFWHWVHIDGPDLDVIGASLPGVPVIVSGTNRFVAWGLTNSYMKASSVSSVAEAELTGTQFRRPLIWVKFWKIKLPFFFKTYRVTGTALPILPTDASEGKVPVLNWSGFQLKAEDFDGFDHFMKSKNSAELDQALSKIGVPSWNFVFADTGGNIGFRAVGIIPRLPLSLPFGVRETSSSQLEWSKMLSPDEMPRLMNPTRGYIVTANNRHWPAGDGKTENYGGRTYIPGFRAFRIEELLQRTPLQDLETQRKIQCDVHAIDGRFLLPPLLKILGEEIKKHTAFRNREMKALQALRSWDYEVTLDCKACPVYRRWIDRLLDDQNLNEAALYRRSQSASVSDGFRKSILNSFLLALDDLGIESSGKLMKWEKYHQSDFQHFSKSEAFKTDALPTLGDTHTVNPGTMAWKDGSYQHTHGASQRLLVHLKQPPAVFLALPGPNQDAEGPDVADPNGPWEKWIRCELDPVHFPINWSEPSIKADQIQL